MDTSEIIYLNRLIPTIPRVDEKVVRFQNFERVQRRRIRLMHDWRSGEPIPELLERVASARLNMSKST